MTRGGSIKTQARLAHLLGCSQQTAGRRLKDPDCPVPAKGPWTQGQVKKMGAWMATLKADPNPHQAKGGSGGSGGSGGGGESPPPQDALGQLNVRAIDARLKAERTLKIRLEREILQGDYLPKHKVVEGWVERAAMFKAGLDGVASSLAPLLVNQPDVRRVETLIREAHNDLLEGYSRPPRPGLEDAA